jgi:VanZ family protein
MADKLLHGTEYAFFGMLIIRAIERSPRHPRTLRACIFLAIGIVFLYGISDDFHQSFVPYRDASAFDLMADVVGGTVGVLLGHHLIKRRMLP